MCRFEIFKPMDQDYVQTGHDNVFLFSWSLLDLTAALERAYDVESVRYKATAGTFVKRSADTLE